MVPRIDTFNIPPGRPTGIPADIVPVPCFKKYSVRGNDPNKAQKRETEDQEGVFQMHLKE